MSPQRAVLSHKPKNTRQGKCAMLLRCVDMRRLSVPWGCRSGSRTAHPGTPKSVYKLMKQRTHLPNAPTYPTFTCGARTVLPRYLHLCKIPAQRTHEPTKTTTTYRTRRTHIPSKKCTTLTVVPTLSVKNENQPNNTVSKI
jgi:hypothetical protein